MPLISVVLPVYDAEDFIERAIKSILQQTLTDFELIIVANGSNTETMKVIGTFSDKRIRTLFLPKPDIVEALNAGIMSATGKIIARMDADDYSEPARFEKQFDFLEKHGLDVASCLVEYEGDAKKNYGYYLHVEWLNSVKRPAEIYQNRFMDSPVAHPTLLVRREVFDKYGRYKKGAFPEDYELILRWLENGVKIGKVDEKLLTWKDHPNRLSRNNTAYSQDAFYDVKARYFSRWFRQYYPLQNEVLVWGAGKSVRQKCHYLEKYGIKILGFIDVKRLPNSRPEVPVYHYSSFPDNIFILSYVGDREGKNEIFRFLIDKGFKQGANFFMMS